MIYITNQNKFFSSVRCWEVDEIFSGAEVDGFMVTEHSISLIYLKQLFTAKAAQRVGKHCNHNIY